MTALRRAFALLKKHAPVVDHTGVTCACMADSQFDDPFRVATAEEYAAHLASVLDDADDLAVVELPEGIYADGVWVALDGSGSISGIEGPAHGLVMSAAKMLAAARDVDEAARS